MTREAGVPISARTAAADSCDATVPFGIWFAAAAPRALLWISAWLDPSRCLRGDSLGYLALARNMIQYHVFSSDTRPVMAPETFRTPAYPLFIAAFDLITKNNAPLAIAAAQCALGAATAGVAWVWMNKTFGRRPAHLCALVMALDPVILFHTPIVLSETLFTFSLLAASIATWRALKAPALRGAIVSGLWWSFATMVKPITLYLPVPLCIFWRRDKKSLAAFLIAAYLMPAAWTIRNERMTGHAIFSSVGGVSMLRYPAAGVEALRTGRPAGQLDIELREQVDKDHPKGYATDADLGEAYMQAATPIVRAHPFLLARYWTFGMVKVLGGTGLEMLLEWTSAWRSDRDELERTSEALFWGTLRLLRKHPALIPLQLGYMLALSALYLMALAGMARLWTVGERPQALLLGGCAAYFLILSGSQGYYRYRIPMMPFLAASAAAAISFPLRSDD